MGQTLRCHLPSRAPHEDQDTAELGLKSHPCLATSPSLSCLLSPLLSVSPNRSQARESSSQVLILGALDQGHRHYSYAASLLKELSSSLERLTYHKLENSRFTRIPFGESAVFVWKDNLINSLGAKLIPYRRECCWCQDVKRRG